MINRFICVCFLITTTRVRLADCSLNVISLLIWPKHFLNSKLLTLIFFDVKKGNNSYYIFTKDTIIF